MVFVKTPLRWCTLHVLLPVFTQASDKDSASAANFLAATYAPAALQLGHSSQKHQRFKTRTNAIHEWRKQISSLLDNNESPLLSLLQVPASAETTSSSKTVGPYPLQSMNEKDAIIIGKHRIKRGQVGDAKDLQIAFDALDKNRDRGISLSEFSKTLQPLVDSHGHRIITEHKFNAWDKNRDGHIDLQEFKSALEPAKVGHEYLPVFKSLTMHGPIDRKKIAKLLNHELHGRADITDEQLDAILQENGGLPEKNPVLDSLAQLTPIMDSIVAFQLVDHDDNGYLSGPELSSFLQSMTPGTPNGSVLLQGDDGPGDEDGNGQISFYDFYTLTRVSGGM
eukprot:gnl/MRDRNA2_/MRDRNA2_116212_c0_seq1.p1 gnl/MRDRNA2_/MRDRNA2_116212_c0~~gnl/MRDRNA2_/MRDRNA2_116212_c0_seq1.p1  ORF type:complete len:337 (-),score=60.91 gnl/MRDRNA2_/MRDRNA2_116212_c0_seq1:7-1017(-)